MKSIKNRLEYLRKQIQAENISYGEIAELQELREYIDPSDTLLLQWANVEEEGETIECGNCGREFSENEEGAIVSETINRCSRCANL